jgi:type IV secretory pathway VirB9-like protein
MTPRYGFAALAMAACLLVGCAGTTLPPALPDDRVRFAPTAAHPLEEPGYATPQELTDLAPSMPPRVVTPPADTPRKPERPERPGRRARREHTQSAEQIIRSANADATVGPRSGLTASAITRYEYNEDSIYLVYVAPNAPTFLRLPPGHHLAVPIPANDKEWTISKVEMSLPGDMDQQGWLVSVDKAGLDTYASLISKEGFVAKCHLKSFEKTAMLEVVWNWKYPTGPQGPTPTGGREPEGPPTVTQWPRHRPEERQSVMLTAMKPPTQAQTPPVKLKPPSFNLERLHTGYKIEVVSKHTPPWVPTSVIDDGSKTVIRFKENLGFTSAPDLFAIHTDGSPAPVEFVPYTSDNGETMMYLIPGLFPQLSLRGRNDLHVKITRIPQK